MDIDTARSGGVLAAQIVVINEKLAVLNDADKRSANLINLTLTFKFATAEGAEEEAAKTLPIGDLTPEASQGCIALAIKIFQAQVDALSQQLAGL